MKLFILVIWIFLNTIISHSASAECTVEETEYKTFMRINGDDIRVGGHCEGKDIVQWCQASYTYVDSKSICPSEPNRKCVLAGTYYYKVDDGCSDAQATDLPKNALNKSFSLDSLKTFAQWENGIPETVKKLKARYKH